MAASTYLAQVQQLYIAYFGRPADPIGLQYWATQIDAANGSIAAVQAGFSASTESQALFGNKSTIDKVTAIYQNAFGRAPEPAGLAYWVAQLDSGKVTQAQASWTIQQSAGAGDAAAVQNKLTAAQAFTAQIDTTAEIQGYQGTGAADAGRAFLATVNQNNASATAAVANAATALATAVNAGGTTGSSFVLTAGVDNLVGTTNNDTFTADNTSTTAAGQLSAADTINGGAGVDTLRVFLAATGTNSTSVANPTLTNVENVLLNGGALTAYTAIAGTTGLIIEAPTVTGATYTVAGQAVTLKGFTGAAGTTSIASTTDTTESVTVNGWGNAAAAQTVDLLGTKVTSATLNATGANSVVTLANTGAALTSLAITGDKSVVLTESLAALTTINASATTGGVTIGVNATNNVTVTGGTGNDKVGFGSGQLTSADVVDGGAGTDTLVLGETAAVATATYAGINAVKNFEVLAIGGNGGIVDIAQVTGFTQFGLTGAGNSGTFNNALASSKFLADTSTDLGTLTVSNKVGEVSTSVTLNNTDTAVHTVAGLTVSGISSIGLVSTGTAANTVSSLAVSDNSNIVVTGSAALTITAITGPTTTGVKVDGSAFTGKLTVTGVTGVSDTIIGGSGDDVLSGGAGAIADTLTGGAGKDKFVIVSGNTSTTFDTITDFVTKVDTISFGTAVTAANVTKATAAVADFTTALAAANAVFVGTGTVKANVQQVGADSYVFFENGTAAGVDQIVKLTGVALAGVDAADLVA
jgi:hypothetical protein